MKTKVYIRADGSKKLGLGHLVRCIALAQMLENDFKISFVCKEIVEDTANEIKKLGFNLSIIKKEVDFINQLNATAIVVLDQYNLDSNYQRIIKEKGCKLVCIDDTPDKVFFADLIINHAPGITPKDYQAQLYTQFALGPEYALLRPAFLNQTELYKEERVIETVFVCFGGSDSKNITHVVVEILKKDKRFKKIIVVTGAAYTFLHDLKQLIQDDKRFCLYDSLGSESLCRLIAEAELAIVPASGILQEVLSIGCKVISGTYAKNQKYIYEKYKELGAFESAGRFSKGDIVKAINRSFKYQSKPSIKFIDGKSGNRLLRQFKQLQIENHVLLRNAEESDLLKTFEWASNPEIRRFFFNSNPIEFESHKKWFISKLNDKNCFYYLATLDRKVFGSIRFDMYGENAKVSYLVDPSYHDRGLGTILLKKGLSLFVAQLTSNVTTICGEVFFDNLASVKVFQKLGYYTESDLTTNIVKFKKRIRS